MNLQTGKTYRGRMLVTTPVFDVVAEQVITELEGVGFKDVKVWFNAKSLPSDWPDDKKQDVSDFGETQVWLEGTWNGEDDVEMPTKGEYWMAYDAWEKQSSESGESFGKSRTEIGKAMYMGAWALGIFLVGLPILLASTWDTKR
jgi:hypothetical protein